jgi:nucleoid-associated protein YgaU
MTINPKTITVAGGNLFQIAAQYLGDATQWNRIATLNGLTDPNIVGIVTLKLPPMKVGGGNGGILGE